MSRPPRWTELTRTQRRRQVSRTVLHVVVAWVIVLGLYSALPLDGASHPGLRLASGVALLGILMVWEVVSVFRARIPALRAVEALGTIIVMFLAIFASAYLAMSHADPTHFSTRLDHVGAIYFATTVFATVGFGDISAVGDLAQVVVTAQMLLDFVLVGLVVRALIRAAKLGQDKTRSPEAAGPSAGEGP